jgi:hypothetical protein
MSCLYKILVKIYELGGNKMKKFAKSILVFLFTAMLLVPNVSFAKTRTGEITPKTVLAGALSLLVWPGIGQAVNDNKGEKVATHAVLGLTGVYRFWSCYDAVVDRQGGYWKGRI